MKGQRRHSAKQGNSESVPRFMSPRFSLRGTTNSRGGLIISTLAMVDLNHLPSGAHYFPHVVNGGSFKTVFLMMSTGTSAPQLSLFATDGKPMMMPVE
jgi:hypothetical protein